MEQFVQEHLKWTMRGGTVFTLMNSFLWLSEYLDPCKFWQMITKVFGGWNGFSFGLSTTLGFAGFALLHLFSRRTIEEIHLLKSGDFVEIKYYNAFWVNIYCV